MRYYVIASDGQRYGPADLATLNGWVQEGRVLQEFILEEETTGRRIAATAVPGLQWHLGGPTAYNPPAQNYYQRPNYVFDGGEKELRTAWTWSILSIFCCGIVGSIVGIVYAFKAKEKGNPNYLGPVIVSIIGLILSSGWAIFSRR